MQAQEDTKKYGKTFAIIAWLLLFALLFFFFQDYIGQQINPNQKLHSANSQQGETVTVLQRNRAGHYVGTALFNGTAADFMLDTGATTIAVPATTAEHLGLSRGASIQVSTANGTALAYRSKIDTVQLGDIILHNVPASIVPNMGGTEILLGMSALKQLEFRQQGNQLTLVQRN